ncbi:MAG: hypothetical protein AAGB05_08980 [Pseudomonadota bacterium]
MAKDDLTRLLNLLGPDVATKGYTNGPLPVVSLDAFFNGNTDEGAFQGAPLETAEAGLRAIAARPDVTTVALGITQWEGEDTWPLAEYIFVATSAPPETIHGWLKDARIHVSEIGQGSEHRPRAEIPTAPGDHIVWAWID